MREHGVDARCMEDPITISKQDYADTLYFWLSEHLSRQEVKAMAEQVGFRLTGLFGMNKKRYGKFYSELFALNMYLIVLTCGDSVSDESTRNDVLELFHKRVYSRNIRITGISYGRWNKMMQLIYEEYTRTIKGQSLLTPVLLIAQAWEENLFGESVLDPHTRFETGMRIGGIVQQLSRLLDGYVIER